MWSERPVLAARRWSLTCVTSWPLSCCSRDYISSTERGRQTRADMIWGDFGDYFHPKTKKGLKVTSSINFISNNREVRPAEMYNPHLHSSSKIRIFDISAYMYWHGTWHHTTLESKLVCTTNTTHANSWTNIFSRCFIVLTQRKSNIPSAEYKPVTL